MQLGKNSKNNGSFLTVRQRQYGPYQQSAWRYPRPNIRQTVLFKIIINFVIIYINTTYY